jgi:hypothetical protein
MRRPATAKRLSASAEAWEKRFPSYSALRRTPQKRIYLERRRRSGIRQQHGRGEEKMKGEMEKGMNGSSDESIITYPSWYTRVTQQPFIHECIQMAHIYPYGDHEIEHMKRSHNRNYVYKRT